MAFYRSLEVGYQSFKQPEWAMVEQCLREPKSWPNSEISVYSGDEETYLSVTFLENQMFLIYGCGLQDTEYFVLVQLDEDDARVRFWDGQEEWDIPRFACANEETMIKVIKNFYETGHKDESMTWWEDTYVFRYYLD